MISHQNVGRSFIVLGVFCIGAVSLTSAVAQVEEWVARYSHPPENSNDTPYAIATDTSGNVVVTGNAGTTAVIITIKYDSNGNMQWVARYDGAGYGDDHGAAIATDASDNVYVTGSSVTSSGSTDITTIKYDPSGNERWIAHYDGPAEDPDFGIDVALDAAGNVYVAGMSWGNNFDYITIKYDPSGKQQWAARYDGPVRGYDRLEAMSVDAVGNVCITGWSQGVGNDYATIAYDPSGKERWVARYNGPDNLTDEAYAIAMDSSGSVYVTGWSEGTSTDRDYATVKYDSGGNQQWVARYDGPDSRYDEAYEMGVDGLGSVCVTGESRDIDGTSDCTTIKYDSSGKEMWVSRFNAPKNASSEPRGMVLDDADNIYVASMVYGNDDSDCAVVKYDPAGVEQWVALFDSPIGFSDNPNGIAIDSATNVYITAGSQFPFYDYSTVKYSQASAAFPASFMIVEGERRSGGLSDLFTSNDRRIDIQAAPAIIVEVTGTAGPGPVNRLRFRVEALSTGSPIIGVRYRIELYDFVSQSWEVFERPASSIDRGEVVDITEKPERFIDPGTRRMRSRLSWSGPEVLFPNWASQIDQTIWLID